MRDDPVVPHAPGPVKRDLATQPIVATTISAVEHEEAKIIALGELARFLDLVGGLKPDDWTRPTVCTLWDVRQVVAHVAGAAASYASWRELGRQWSPLRQRPYRRSGMSILDALNQIQVDDRARSQPADLIDELHNVGPRAIATRSRLPAPLRALRLPMPALGYVPIGYLTDVIYTRDMWIHRVDLSRATGQNMTLTAEHDGRIIALAMRDLGAALQPLLQDTAVVYALAGPAGGHYLLGADVAPAATITLDALDFAWLAAGRLTTEQVRAVAELEGDQELAERVMTATTVPI